jgi:hypothetical protein
MVLLRLRLGDANDVVARVARQSGF